MTIIAALIICLGIITLVIGIVLALIGYFESRGQYIFAGVVGMIVSALLGMLGWSL